MPDIATAFREAQLLARRATDAARSAPHGINPVSVGIDVVEEERAVHCFDPWIIIRSEPNREEAARRSLAREGFECWYPAGRLMRILPQRFVSSKTRHKKRRVIVEDLRRPFPGYLFVRRMAERSQSVVMGRLWELDGVLGVCMFGEHLAIAEDYEIQLLRVKEDLGQFDRWDVAMSMRDYRLAEIRRTDAVKERWDKPPSVIGSLDTTRGASLVLIEAFGRITRVVAAAGDQHMPVTPSCGPV